MFRPMLLGSTGLAVLLSGAALAMPQVPIIPLDMKPGQNYVTVDGQWSGVPKDEFTWLDVCGSQGEQSLGNEIGGSEYCGNVKPKPFLDASHDFNAWGGGGIIGSTMEHPWMGDRQRFETGFAGLTGDRDDSRSEAPTMVQAATSLDSIGGIRDIQARAHTSYDAFAVVERTLFDFEISPSLTITPNVGVVFRHDRNDVQANGSWTQYGEYVEALSGTVLASRNQLVTSTEFGLELGTTASYDLTKAFKLFAGVNAEFLHRDGKFRGHDCFVNQYTGTIQPNTVTDSCLGGADRGGGYDTRAFDKISDTAVNVTLSLGASYSFPGGTTISLIGLAQNEDHLVVANSSPGQVEEFGVASTQHLESRRDWTPGAVIALTVPFGSS